MHQVGNQPRLYYDARSTNHQDGNLCSQAFVGARWMRCYIGVSLPVFAVSPMKARISWYIKTHFLPQVCFSITKTKWFMQSGKIIPFFVHFTTLSVSVKLQRRITGPLMQLQGILNNAIRDLTKTCAKNFSGEGATEEKRKKLQSRIWLV